MLSCSCISRKSLSGFHFCSMIAGNLPKILLLLELHQNHSMVPVNQCSSLTWSVFCMMLLVYSYCSPLIILSTTFYRLRIFCMTGHYRLWRNPTLVAGNKLENEYIGAWNQVPPSEKFYMSETRIWFSASNPIYSHMFCCLWCLWTAIAWYCFLRAKY